MALVAVETTPLIGPGSGSLDAIADVTRPTAGGLKIAAVGDTGTFTYTAPPRTVTLTITDTLASLVADINGNHLALQGTEMSDSSVTIGVPPQLVLESD